MVLGQLKMLGLIHQQNQPEMDLELSVRRSLNVPNKLG